MELSEIKQVRINHGLSQQQAADLIGIDRSFLTQLENGSRKPSYEVMKKISTAYGEKIEI